ncbi:MAG: alpha/beta hydrolase [Pseudomonadota bacterium]
MTIIALVAVLLVAAAAYPYFSEWRRLSPTGNWKDSAPGQFVELSGGETHFQWRGPLKGPIAVCIHGLTTPSGAFEAVAEDLSTMGFRVLTYDLYGRGYSASGESAQTLDVFLAQLSELLESEGVKTGTERGDNLLLVGYSMGAMIATRFAINYPERIDRLVLLAAAGLGQNISEEIAKMRDRPWVGDWIMLGFGARTMAKEISDARDAAGELDVEGIYDYQLAQLRRQGYLPAVLSSLRHTLQVDQFNDHESLARMNLPVLAIWAEDDEIIPESARARMAEANPKARQVVLSGVGHDIAFTSAADIRAAIQAFLKTII